MTPITGFVIAIIAGLMVRSPRRAAAVVVVPYLAVAAAQSWMIASGRGISPPSTVTGWPDLIGYWLVQLIFFLLPLGIAAELAALRARRADPDAVAAGMRRSLIRASAVEATLTVAFLIGYLLDSAPVQHHSADGSPPAQGFIGMVLCLGTFVVLSVLAFRGRGRGSVAGTTPAEASASAVATGGAR
jgi:hypothetical protein